MAEAAQDIAAPGVQLAPGQAGAINLKIENAKLPIFYGQQGKDTVTAAHIIQRVVDLTATNHWSPEDAYHHFSLALQGSAQEWLRMIQQKGDRPEKTWTYIEPLFRKEFSLEEDDTALLDQLRHLEKRPNERIRDYGSRVCRIMEILERAHTEVPPVEAAANPAGHYTQAEVLAYGAQRDQGLFKYITLQLFKAGLPIDMRKTMQQQKPKTFIKALDIAGDQERCKDSARATAAIEEDDAVEAIQPSFRPNRPQNTQNQRFNGNNWNKRPQQQNYNQRQPQQQRNTYQQQQKRQNNSNTNAKQICAYCRIPNHHQDECRKRIAANAPCISASGKPYYPKAVNEISNQDPAVNLIQPVQDFHF